MRKNVKNTLLVIVVILLLGLLVGCCCPTCPTCSQETHPENVEKIDQCSLLKWIRPLTPLALRWLMADWYSLVSKADIEWALSQIGPWECCMSLDDIIDSIHALKGYEDVPVGYVEYKNGEKKIIIICKEEGEKKAFLLINKKLEQLIEDSSIIDVII